MKRDLILVNPPQRGLLDGFATGLIDLANFVAARAPDAESRIADLALTAKRDLPRAALSALKEVREAPLVGITTTTAGYQASLDVARAFKALSPDCVVVLGGHHASPQHDVVLRRHRCVDLVIRGEGERALLALVRGAAPEETPGCSSLRDGELIANPSAPLLSEAELDELPVGFEGFRYDSAPGKFDHATYVSARGCPLRCAFCAVAGQAIRAKGVPRVVADLEHLVGDLGYRSIAIEDNFFGQRRSRVLAICDAIAGLQATLDAPFAWDCQTRVESMRSPEVLDALARAECEGVYLGVESLIEAELEYLGKTARPARYVDLVMEVCAAALRRPFGCYVNLQVGLPGEDLRRQRMRRERLARLGDLAAKVGRTVTVFPQLHVVYPGTQHFRRAVQEQAFGHLSAEIFEPFTEWEAAEEPILQFLGENFAHGVGGIPLGILDSQRLRRGEFLVQREAVGQLQEHLSDLSSIEGVEIFKYGEHLAPNPTPGLG